MQMHTCIDTYLIQPLKKHSVGAALFVVLCWCRQSFRSAGNAARQQTLERLAALQQLLGEPIVCQPGSPLQIQGGREMLQGITRLMNDCQAMWDGESE